MIIELYGESLGSEGDFHEALANALDLSEFYGRNLDALWDVLSIDVERPLQLVWINSEKSKQAMGARFDQIVKILRRVEQYDLEAKYKNRFELALK
ncbi:barstar family protein [Undibacterium sp. Ji42W]|uniref:barstar family protein n=1 Tax=Undibacterium sp. Ji42W TaxID=3413039 RepID=UPI003BF24C11